MVNRDDDERGFRGGMDERGRGFGRDRDVWGRRQVDEGRYDLDAERERWRGPRGRYDVFDEGMGGVTYDARERAHGWGGDYERGWGPREHGGFSNYGGGGQRDIEREREDEWAREHRAYPETTGGGYGGYRPDNAGGRNFGPMRGREPGGSSQAPQDWGERGPHYGKGPKNYRRSDERIREDVCDAIAQQGYIDASDVEVRVDDRVVTLSGTVVQRSDKRSLEQMAERIYGVEEVQNELRLKRDQGRGAYGGSRGDGSQGHNGNRNARA